MSADSKKTPYRRPRKIKLLHPDRKDEDNWPIKGQVEFYDHSATRCGYNISKDGLHYFKCRLRDDSGMIDVIAYDKFLADSYVEHFKRNDIVIIKKAKLGACKKNYKHINNHAYQILIKEDTDWDYGKRPRKAKSKDSSARPLRRTRSMDKAPRASTSTSSSMDMNQNASNGMDGDENKEKQKGLKDGAGIRDARTAAAPPSMANIGGQGSINVFPGGQVSFGPGSTILMNRSSSELNQTVSNGACGDANDEKVKGSSRRDTIP